MPNSHPEMLVQAHRNSTYGLANYSGLSLIHPDQSITFDEPPPPYPNNSLPVGPLSDVFSQPALLPTDRLLNVEPIISSPLAPVPLRHSSLYQVLKQESPTSSAQGTLQFGTSSIAHALELQESQSRQAAPLSTPVLGNSMIGASGSALSASQITTTSLAAVAADPCLHLPEDSTAATSAQPLSPVSSTTPPCTSVARRGSVVTAHTLAPSQPEVTTDDYDTFPRLRKVSYPLPLALVRMPYTNIYERALALFSSNHRYLNLPKTILLHQARSHHCHRAHHLRWALRHHRPRSTVRPL